jgi:hypothetical protein
MRCFISRSAMSLVACALTASPMLAAEPAEAEVKSTAKESEKRAHAHHDSAAIPDCVQKLGLSPAQHDQVKEIVRSYDVSLGTVWKQFSHRYMQTIAMESSLLAAIEDNLTEPQRTLVRGERRKTAQHEQTVAATSDKPNQATAKPTNAVEEELAGVGVTLTPAQVASADAIHEKYRSQLRSMNRDIQGLHTRLLSLEADKLVAIEKVLTKDQLSQLRINRQTAPEAPKVVVGHKVSTPVE